MIQCVLSWIYLVQGVAIIIGTFFMIFARCGSVLIDKKTSGSITHLGVSLVWGMAVMILVYAIGHILGSHLNSAVTLAFSVVRRFPWTEVCMQYFFPNKMTSKVKCITSIGC